MERQFGEEVPTIEARAAQLLAHAEWMTNLVEDRTEAFLGIFGLGGSYVTLFPTMDDRLALRDLPARRELFSILWRMPHPVEAGIATDGHR